MGALPALASPAVQGACASDLFPLALVMLLQELCIQFARILAMPHDGLRCLFLEPAP